MLLESGVTDDHAAEAGGINVVDMGQSKTTLSCPAAIAWSTFSRITLDSPAVSRPFRPESGFLRGWFR